jgi:hypothetical protein
LIATALFASYKSGTPIALYILVCAIGRDVSAEYDRDVQWSTMSPRSS